MYNLRMVYSLIIRADVRNHQFFTVVLYTDQDTFYKISSCSGNVKEEAGKSSKIKEESGRSQGSQGRVREAKEEPRKSEGSRESVRRQSAVYGLTLER